MPRLGESEIEAHLVSPSDSFPPALRAWSVIAILWLVTLFSQLDRQLPALLVKPLKAEFALTDTQFSLLQGYGFALAYTLMGLPFGRLVDRANRRNLILLGILVWSAMTVAAGFATSYVGLILARVGVGVGEAVLAPAAYSIIADYVAPSRRGRALSFYYVSLAIGSGASLLLGGLILGALPHDGLVLAGTRLAPWQLSFIAAGAPGLILAMLMLLVKEPARRETKGASTASIGDFLRYLRAHASTFSRLLTYPAVIAAIGYGMLAWAPALFQRQYGLPIGKVGVTLGLLVALGGLSGTLLSGYLSDRWVAAGKPAARFRVTLVAWVIVVPTAIAWPLMPNASLAFIFLTLTVGGFAVGQAAAPAAIQEVFPNQMRGQAVALYLLVAGLVGIGFGPMMIGLATDLMFGNDAMIGFSIALTAAPLMLLGVYLSLSGLKPYEATLANLRRDGAGR
jgi:MFS family permease